MAVFFTTLTDGAIRSHTDKQDAKSECMVSRGLWAMGTEYVPCPGGSAGHGAVVCGGGSYGKRLHFFCSLFTALKAIYWY